MKKQTALSILPLAAGLALGLLRGIQRLAAYEPETRLMTAHHPLSWAFWGCLALYALAELLIHHPWKERPQLADLRLQPPGDAAAYGMTLGALLVLAGSVVMACRFFSAGPDAPGRTLALVLAILGVPAGLCMIRLAAAAKRHISLTQQKMSLILPIFWGCGWGIRCLWVYSVDPVLDDYLPDLAAILLLLLGLSYLAGFAFQDGYPRRVQLFCRLAAAVTLAVTLGAALYAAVTAGAAAALWAAGDRLAVLGGSVFLLTCDAAIAATPPQGPASPEAQP